MISDRLSMLPEYIEVATTGEISKQVALIWRDQFVPGFLQDRDRVPSFRGDDQLEIGLDQYALTSAVGNALIDIQRWATFHLSKPESDDQKARPDRHKYAGFLAKWIAKERPIYIRHKDPSAKIAVPTAFYRLNAFFAITVMQSYLKKKMQKKLIEELAYILHFRDERGETLAVLAYCAEELGEAKTPKGKA